MRYFAAAEARNNFIAAGQNVQSCRVYLGRVKFPYATEEEMAQMEQAIQNAFNDIQSNASLKKALNVYQTTHKKVASLIQWFDKVINDTILKDLDKANTNVAKKQKQLREERLELMRKKVKEEFGRDLEITYDNDAVDESDEELLALEADAVKDQNDLPGEDLKEILNLSQPEGRDPSPLPLNQLAPIPTKDALFGDVKKKITEYEDARDALQKRNLMMREKQELALQ
ncbi:Protein W03G9.7, partial [Aphelenchoides avenae]